MVIKSLLKDYLQALQAGGELRLPVDEQARPILRKWMQDARRGMRPAPRPAAAEAAPAYDAPVSAPEASGLTVADIRREMETPSAKSEGMSEEEMPLYFRPPGQTPAEQWEQAPQFISRWGPIRELKTLRDTPVWGEGSASADIIFVGDAPNYYDEQARRPFCGEAGGKLDGMLKAMNLTRRQVYITHLVKYRPMLPRQTFNNRPPSRDEVRVSLPVLEFEVRMVQPRVIVALGVIAARALLQCEDLPLTACQQIADARFCGVPVVVTHHPSYLLRTTSLSERRRLWEEMLRVMEIAQLPITDKQRGYFLPKA